MNQKSRQAGDRKDGRRLRNLDAMHVAMPYIMPNRCDAEVYLNEKIDVTEALRYIKIHNTNQNELKLTLFHLVLAALSKTIIHRPYMNRFISGRRYYERNSITFSFVAKKQFSDKGEESLMILKVDEDTVLEQVARKVIGDVKEVRDSGGNNLDQIIDLLVKLPRPILRVIVTMLNIMEYYGIVPGFFAEMLPYYSTVLISNLGSIKCGAPYHHLTNFGTNSVMITIGEIHKEYIPGPDGTPALRDIVEMGFTIDERIGDGFYFAKSIKLFKQFMSQPDMLEHPFKEEVTENE